VTITPEAKVHKKKWAIEKSGYSLKKHGFKKRKALKNQKIGSCENRNEQFENINSIRSEYLQNDNPIISMDSKKKNF